VRGLLQSILSPPKATFADPPEMQVPSHLVSSSQRHSDKSERSNILS
jgi:hypothetical protein